MHRLIHIATSFLMLGWMVCLTGCHASSQHRVAISGEPTPGATTFAVEINNTSGGVVIVAEPSMPEPAVQARLRGEGSATDQIDAVVSGSTLRVSRSAGSDPSRLVDITVWVPATSGVQVRTEQGSVTLQRVRGPVEVVVGEATGKGGSIDLRTQHAMTEGIRLSTTEGSVFALLPTHSSGSVEMQSANGQAFVRSPSGELTGGRIGNGFYTGTLNQPGPAITMLTGVGDVTLHLQTPPFPARFWPHPN